MRRARMRKTIQIVLAASLCGCVSAPPELKTDDQSVTPIPVSLALEEIVTTGVRQRLQNPASARFGTMVAGERRSDGHRQIMVCGYVSPTGAHADGEPFAARIYPDTASSFELVAMGGQSPNSGHIVDTACQAAGLPLPAPNSKIPS